MLNRATIIGHVGQDPEVRTTANGTEVASFSVATSERWKDKSTGEKKERTEWHRVVVWNEGLIGVIKQYVAKGSKLYVEGQLRTRKWTDQEGHDRYTTEIVLSNFDSKLVLLDRKPGNGPSDADDPRHDRGGGSGGGGGRPQQSTPRHADLDDEIPF